MTKATEEHAAAEAGADEAVAKYLEPFIKIVQTDLIWIVEGCTDDSTKLRDFLRARMHRRDYDTAMGLLAGAESDKRLQRLGVMLSLADRLVDGIEETRKAWLRENERKRMLALGHRDATTVDEQLRGLIDNRPETGPIARTTIPTNQF